MDIGEMVAALKGSTMRARRRNHPAWCARDLMEIDGRIHESHERDTEYLATSADLIATDWEVCERGDWGGGAS